MSFNYLGDEDDMGGDQRPRNDIAPHIMEVNRRPKGRKRGVAEFNGCVSTSDLITQNYQLAEENWRLKILYRTLASKVLMMMNKEDDLARVSLVELKSEPGETFHIPPATHDNANGGDACITVCTRRRMAIGLKLVTPSLRPDYTVPSIVRRRWEMVQAAGDAGSSSSRERSEEVTIDGEDEEVELLQNDIAPTPEWRHELVTTVLKPSDSELGKLRPVNASVFDAVNGVVFKVAIQIVGTGEIWTGDDFPGKETQDFLNWMDGGGRTRDYFHIAYDCSEALLLFQFRHKSTGAGGAKKFRLLVYPADPALRNKYPNLSWSSCAFRTLARIPDAPGGESADTS